ncbi:competence type IV pilus assembly protein ComGB [Bacillus massiliigorillae]|uniref:competence type IV pilus assembly protein ComGB n=1 Tax=Bacillus massiliigorillae TaxID=1243664 RepID=UPI0012B6431A|nr:competence type IV pilus assembly protein ComGB [Bacillus massiliigorillae]
MSIQFDFLKMKFKKPLHLDLYEKKSLEGGSIRNRQGKWKRSEQAVFLFRLGELLASGYHLSDALRFIESQEHAKRRAYIEEAIIRLKDGQTLHEVLLFLRFHPQLLQFVYYAEYYGDLPHALMEGGRFWSKRNQDRDKLLKMLIYPILLLVLIIVIAFLLQGILLPKFQSLYESMDMAPSFFLESILLISSISHFTPYFILGIVVIIVTVQKLWLNKLCHLQRKKYVLKIPLLGVYIRLFDTYYFTYQLSGLLAGGLSINDSIQLFAKHNHQPFFQKLSEVIFRELNEGRSLENIFKELPYFERYISDVMANGQKNGKLDQELYHYSRILLQTIEDKMIAVIKIIQPLLFATVGSIVVAIYLSVLLPMFTILEGL